MRDCEKNGDWHNARYQELVEVLIWAGANSHQQFHWWIQWLFQLQRFKVTIICCDGKLKEWDICDRHKIKVPTLLTFGEHETMPLKSAQRMAQAIPNSRLVTTPNGGHHHMIDNAPVYFKHLADYLRDVESGKF